MTRPHRSPLLPTIAVALAAAACTDTDGHGSPPARSNLPEVAPAGRSAAGDPAAPTLTARIATGSGLVPAGDEAAARGAAWYLSPVAATLDHLDALHAAWLAAQRGDGTAVDPRHSAAHTSRGAVASYLEALLAPPAAPTAKLREEIFARDPRGLEVRIRVARRALDDYDSELGTIGLLEPLRAHLDGLPRALDRAASLAERAPLDATDPGAALAAAAAAVAN